MDEKLRNSRQETLAPSIKLKEADCVVIGVGAVGRQVARQLASLGVKNLEIWDDDLVAIENLAPQGYNENQLGLNKAAATAIDCKALNSNVNLKHESRRFAKSDFKRLADKYVFLCVDSIDVRKNIYEAACKSKAKWIGDTRVAGENVRVISEIFPSENSLYSKTLFKPEEAFIGSCHSKMFGPGASIAAGAVVAKFTQNLRECLDQFTDHSIDLGDWDLFVNKQ